MNFGIGENTAVIVVAVDECEKEFNTYTKYVECNCRSQNGTMRLERR